MELRRHFHHGRKALLKPIMDLPANLAGSGLFRPRKIVFFVGGRVDLLEVDLPRNLIERHVSSPQ